MEEGTTTTPFDMVVRNQMSRFHLCIEALRRSAYPQADSVIKWCQEMLARHHSYTREHFEDLPEVRNWVWTGTQSDQIPTLTSAFPVGKE
jgi:xylulose-5-phosphate/fructose-6-phosphate phosphoketolase